MSVIHIYSNLNFTSNDVYRCLLEHTTSVTSLGRPASLLGDQAICTAKLKSLYMATQQDDPKTCVLGESNGS